MCACYVRLLCLWLVEFSCLLFSCKIWNSITQETLSWNAPRNLLSISTLFSNLQRVLFIIIVIPTVSPFYKNPRLPSCIGHNFPPTRSIQKMIGAPFYPSAILWYSFLNGCGFTRYGHLSRIVLIQHLWGWII